ncbi:MAG: CBS domain-containing protein [Desulfobacterales bacterium]
MRKIAVKEFMVPIAEYATVSEEATLADAIAALEQAQRDFDCTRYRHRAVLVVDQAMRPIGKISQLDALKALEPKYKEIHSDDSVSPFRHFSRMFVKSMMQQYRLFDRPLEDLRQMAARLKVKDFMHAVSEEDCLNEDATLDEAVNFLIMGRHQSLLVTRKGELVGILRLTDVFSAVFHTVATPGDSADKG